MNEHTCPDCGSPSNTPCRTVIDGVDTGWTHDARILAPILADLRTARTSA